MLTLPSLPSLFQEQDEKRSPILLPLASILPSHDPTSTLLLSPVSVSSVSEESLSPSSSSSSTSSSPTLKRKRVSSSSSSVPCRLTQKNTPIASIKPRFTASLLSSSSSSSSSSNEAEDEEDDEDGEFVCQFCDMHFLNSCRLEQHCRKHVGNRPYCCHMPIHDDNGNVIGKCSQTFTQKSHKDQHRLHHTKEKPYRCEYCDKLNRTLWLHRKHIENHHANLMKYECLCCLTTFTVPHHHHRQKTKSCAQQSSKMGSSKKTTTIMDSQQQRDRCTSSCLPWSQPSMMYYSQEYIDSLAGRIADDLKKGSPSCASVKPPIPTTTNHQIIHTIDPKRVERLKESKEYLQSLLVFLVLPRLVPLLIQQHKQLKQAKRRLQLKQAQCHKSIHQITKDIETKQKTKKDTDNKTQQLNQSNQSNPLQTIPTVKLEEERVGDQKYDNKISF